MTIDIITYTDAQYAALSEEQIVEVKAAQLKKNKLTLKLETEKEAEKRRLMDNGIFISPIWELYCAKKQAEYEAEVESLREALLFYLRFSSKPEDSETSSAPYTVDYSLTLEQRLIIVKTYYEETYADGAERFEAFKTDTVAPQYLGEYYAALYDYLAELAA